MPRQFNAIYDSPSVSDWLAERIQENPAPGGSETRRFCHGQVGERDNPIVGVANDAPQTLRLPPA